MYKVFLCEPIHEKAYDMLKKHVEIISEESQKWEVDAIINRNLQIDRAWMEKSPNLKVIGIHGTGRDGVDLVAAKELGITVIYVPYENADSVAELIVAFTLALARNIVKADRMLQNKETLQCGMTALQGMEISGKTFGLIGCGDIARRAAKILKNGFGMKIIGFSPSLDDEKAKEYGLIRCQNIEEVMEGSDFVNIGVHLTDDTRNMIDKEVLSHAKKGLMLINTARGGVINEQDLYDALTGGIIDGAALDVFCEEPPTWNHPLAKLSNVIATPHIGATTEEALYRVGMGTVTQILKVLNGEEPDYTYQAM